MHDRAPVFLLLVLSFTSLAIAQDKDKGPAKNPNKKDNQLTADVVAARTVLVLVDPDTGISLTDPIGNRTAQQDVEKALLHWGRLTPVLEGESYDLVITVRKGNGKMVNPTIGGVPVNDRPIILDGDDSLIRVGGQRGRPPGGVARRETGPVPGMEIGPAEDMFMVYRGSVNSAPVWRYSAKGALRSPGVPAVAEFRKAIEEAEKQQKNKP